MVMAFTPRSFCAYSPLHSRVHPSQTFNRPHLLPLQLARAGVGGAEVMEPPRDLKLQNVHKQLEKCSVAGSWIFSIAGALLAIPIGIKRKSLGPLLFFGTTGAMMDIWVTVSNCEREYQEKMLQSRKEQEEKEKQNSRTSDEDTFRLDETSGNSL